MNLRNLTSVLPILAVLVVFATDAVAGTLPAKAVPGAMTIQLKDGQASVGAMNLIENGGFKMVRKGIYWGATEKTRGVYNFSLFDPIVTRAEERGLSVLITLFGSNKLYDNGAAGGITTEEGRVGFANFAAAVAKRYAGKKIIFEIWNEPNLGGFWHPKSNTAAIAIEYTDLVIKTVTAMKKADPDAYVVAGSISCLWSDSFRWFDAAIARGILTSGIDGVSVHPYGFNLPESSASGYKTIRAKMDAANATKLSIVNSEVGYNIGWIVERQGYTAVQSEDVQGWMLVRQQMIDLVNGIGFSNWYEFQDASGQWPIASKSLAPLPGYEAAKVYAAQLTGYTYVKQIRTAAPKDYVLLFENAAGKRKLVAWTISTARVPNDHSLAIDVASSGKVTYVDVFGKAGSAAISNQRLTLALTGGPKYIDLSSASPLAVATPTPMPAASPLPLPSPMPTTTNTNVALKKAVTASVGQSSASKLTDGEISTNSRWLSKNIYPQHVVVNLGGNFEIAEVKYLQYTQRTEAFKVEVLTEGKWKTVVAQSANKALNVSAKFSAIKASQVRFTILKGYAYQKGYELQVLGH